MIIHRCTREDCASPVILIEIEPPSSPEQILEIEEELSTKTATHDDRYHSLQKEHQ